MNFENIIKNKLKSIVGDIKLEVPPNPDLGDYSFPCFILSKSLKKNPKIIAKELASKIKSKYFTTKTVGPYLNFYIIPKYRDESILKRVLKEKEKYGSTKNKKQSIMVEFSQPNTHKAFHVGHIRGTSLGESFSRILEFSGNKVIRANYNGDTGMHIAKWIWCYQKYHSKEKLNDNESWIASIYIDAIKKLSKNEKLQLQVDAINKKLEDKSDKKINSLWNKTRTLSIKAWGEIYKELGTHFDVHYFESKVEKRGKEISKKLVDKKIARISDGATIIDLEKYNLGIWILLRKDGTVLYAAKDIALAERKFQDYKLDQSIIIVGDEQSLYFKQLFKTLELINFQKKEKFKYITYGMVRLPSGKMSSRTGDNILYSNFKSEVMDYARSEIKKRNKLSKKELEKRALIISIAAIKFSMLRQDPNKIIIFNKEKALSFEGDTGPYLQYSYARSSSILKKTKTKSKKVDYSIYKEQEEINLIRRIGEFPIIVSQLKPYKIANYALELAQLFNQFYHACPVLNSKKKVREARLLLLSCFNQTLKNSLNLLGIKVLEKM